MMQDEGHTKDEVTSIIGPFNNYSTLLFVIPIHYLYRYNIYYYILSVLDLSGVRGLREFIPLSGASQPHKFSLTLTILVKNSQRYIADPVWFHNQSSTVLY